MPLPSALSRQRLELGCNSVANLIGVKSSYVGKSEQGLGNIPRKRRRLAVVISVNVSGRSESIAAKPRPRSRRSV
jgi:hypothetical protein